MRLRSPASRRSMVAALMAHSVAAASSVMSSSPNVRSAATISGQERCHPLAGGGVHHSPHRPQRHQHLLAIDRRTRPRRRPHRPRPLRLPQRLAGMVSMPTRERTQLVQDHCLRTLGRGPIPPGRRLGHRLPLAHGQSYGRGFPDRPLPTAKPCCYAGHFSMRQSIDYAGIFDESTRRIDTGSQSTQTRSRVQTLNLEETACQMRSIELSRGTPTTRSTS